MKPNIIFIQSKEEFSNQEKSRIETLAQEIFSVASKELKINTPVNFTFYRFGKNNSGFTQAKDWIAVTLPKGPIDYIDLEPMLYHELHHIARGYCGYLENGKHYLLNSLFSEGLATSFELEHSSSERKMTHHKYTAALVKKWLPEMKKELFDTNNYDYAGWFQGKGKPKQLGYKIGKYLVDQIRKKHPEMTHADLARKDARALLKMSGVQF